MDLLFGVVNEEFNVINKSEQGARNLDMEICGSLFDNHRAVHSLDDLFEDREGICCGL